MSQLWHAICLLSCDAPSAWCNKFTVVFRLVSDTPKARTRMESDIAIMLTCVPSAQQLFLKVKCHSHTQQVLFAPKVLLLRRKIQAFTQLCSTISGVSILQQFTLVGDHFCRYICRLTMLLVACKCMLFNGRSSIKQAYM